MRTRIANRAASVALITFATLLGACSAPEGPPVWTETSRSIEVTCAGFFQGSMRFAATRDQLSAAQVDMLSRLQIVNSEPACAGDGMACSLTVAQAGGATTTIESIDLNTTCNDSRKVVSFESFDPFLEASIVSMRRTSRTDCPTPLRLFVPMRVASMDCSQRRRTVARSP